MKIESLIRENIRNLAPYSTARDEYSGNLGIYLDANENPFDSGINRYPDPHQRSLKERLAQIKGVSPSMIFTGNGSDEAIDLMFRIFCTPSVDEAISIAPTYGMYKVAAAINDVKLVEVALDEDFALSAAKILEAVTAQTKLVFLCSPNNPSGNLLSGSDIERVLREFHGIVVLDEAYIDFAAQGSSFLSKIVDYENLVVLQTLSKAWGMAGIRLGLAFASELIISTMNRVKYPYNINVLTNRVALENLYSIDSQLTVIVSERERLRQEFSKFDFIKTVFPSDANFLLIKVEEPRKLYDRLIDRGVIVRDRSRIAGCEGCLRVTVGTPEENSKLLEILGDYQ
ncbi:Histidinol-phosphate aminotransferase [Mucinivorans hirudinis]|uniref:Histidinol-phosphate aminotransferase n=1 Tax=Mucinivorans hirudinis TaxID=1433126 RepID=A0A060R834_9BACT|nr:Histidinol-phosphate aminotransferase [Mucinivorans hirudinis]